MALTPQPNGVRTEADAVMAVRKQVDVEAYPALPSGGLEMILRRHQRAAFWQASLPFCVGDRVQVVQTPENSLWWPVQVPVHGVYYLCHQAGVSGTAQPNWFGAGSFLLSPFGLADGSLLWRYDGPAMPDLWDINAVIHDVWLKKASIVAGRFDVSSAQQSMKRSQVYDHCMRMANRYAPVFIV